MKATDFKAFQKSIGQNPIGRDMIPIAVREWHAKLPEGARLEARGEISAEIGPYGANSKLNYDFSGTKITYENKEYTITKSDKGTCKAKDENGKEVELDIPYEVLLKMYEERAEKKRTPSRSESKEKVT